MFKLVLEKAEEPEIQLPISAGSSKKQESSRKTTISVLLTMPKPLGRVGLVSGCGSDSYAHALFWDLATQGMLLS